MLARARVDHHHLPFQGRLLFWSVPLSIRAPVYSGKHPCRPWSWNLRAGCVASPGGTSLLGSPGSHLLQRHFCSRRVAWCALACLFEVSRAWPAHSTTEIRGDHARAGSLPSLPFRPVPPAPGGDDDGGHNGMESLRGRAARGKHEIPTVDSETEKHNNGDPVGCLPNAASLPRTARAVCITNMLSQVCRLGDLAIRACWVSWDAIMV
jgi:hypothetical protein